MRYNRDELKSKSECSAITDRVMVALSGFLVTVAGFFTTMISLLMLFERVLGGKYSILAITVWMILGLALFFIGIRTTQVRVP